MITDVQTTVTTRLPAEWSLQSGVMLTWPHRESIWLETLHAIDQVYVETTKAITRYEKVLITCFDMAHQNHIKSLLKAANIDINQVRMYLCYSNDIWVRDHGPICIMQQDKPLLLDFIFNGWGDKYPSNFDNNLNQALFEKHAFGKTPMQKVDLILEGGAIETDGMGTLLTTTSCLLARNPKLNRDFMTMRLKQLFGCNRVLWLEHGMLAGDDTDGHIDTLTRFVDPHTIVYMSCDDPDDENYMVLQHMEDQLQTFGDHEGNPYKLVPLPQPPARYARYDGRRLPLSYTNFLIINHAVLVPQYGEHTDFINIEIFKALFPNREVIGIDCSAAIEWYGAIHCFTMQLPYGVF